MKYIYLVLFFTTVVLLNGCNSPKQELSKEITEITPESLGISSQAILDFIEAAENERPNDLHSFILLRHGEVAAEGWWDPYDPESPHMLYSLSKSFTSTAIGIAQAEGLLSINDPVISFFPDETPEKPSENLKAMRIRDLLKMNTGHQQEPQIARQNSESWVKGFLAAEVENKPGTHFVYNSMATFMLSAIIQKVSGQTLEVYLTPRIFEPLGITTHRWEKNMNGINMGGWGLNIRTQDIANFGQLYLQKGKWKDQQLVPEAWVAEATSLQTSNGSNPNGDWDQGYGYQFWMCRHGLYRGDGAFGQFCIVMPDQDAVLAITSGTKDMQAIMNLAWEYLLPAFQEEPIAANEEVLQALKDKLASLKLNPIKGEENSPLANNISGINYTLEENDLGLKSIAFNLTDDEKSMTFSNADSTYVLPIGYNGYEEGIFDFAQVGRQSVATSGAWIEGDTLQLMMYMDETPHGYLAKVAFDGERLTMQREFNVFFGPTKQMDLVGRKAK